MATASVLFSAYGPGSNRQPHRRVLLDHGIDITRKSDVILMKPKRGKLNINTGQSDNAPRQYFAYPGQKPLPVPSDEEGGSE